MIEKPLSLKKEEFINQLVEVVNSSQLPFFLVEDILSKTINEVHRASVEQAKREKEEYEKALAEEEAKQVDEPLDLEPQEIR